MPSITAVECRSALVKSRLPGLDYTLNPYVGCQHGCKYCYAPSLLKMWNKEWGSFVNVKKNLTETLERDLKSKSPGVIGVSTATDPYQPVEHRLFLTRRCLEKIFETDFYVSIQTKSNLITRDLSVLDPDRTDVGFTVTTMNDEITELIEPGASKPSLRKEALEKTCNYGFKTWLFYGPIIPTLNDDKATLNDLIQLAKETESEIIYDKLNLRRGVSDRLKVPLKSLGLNLKEVIHKTNKDDYWVKVKTMIEDFAKSEGVQVEAAFKPRIRLQTTLESF
jgi:DNA repair photolyase